jgi:hypothetical protein
MLRTTFTTISAGVALVAFAFAPSAASADAWTRVPAPTPGRLSVLNAVSAIPGGVAWAVGETRAVADGVPRPLIERRRNGVWSRVNPPPNIEGTLNGVAVVAPDDVWAVGVAQRVTGPEALVLHWDGSGWVRRSDGPTTRPDVVLSGVAAASADNVWAMGTLTPRAPGISSVRRTWGIHFDGTSWTRANFRFRPYDGSGLLGVGAIPGEAITVGWANTLSLKGVWGATYDDGATWTFSQQVRGPRMRIGTPCHLPDIPPPNRLRNRCTGLLGVAVRSDGAALGVGESWQGAYATYMAVPGTFPVDAAPPTEPGQRLLAAAVCPGAGAPFVAAGATASGPLLLRFDGTWSAEPVDPSLAGRAVVLRGVSIAADGSGYTVGSIMVAGTLRAVVAERPAACAM